MRFVCLVCNLLLSLGVWNGAALSVYDVLLFSICIVGLTCYACALLLMLYGLFAQNSEEMERVDQTPRLLAAASDATAGASDATAGAMLSA